MKQKKYFSQVLKKHLRKLQGGLEKAIKQGFGN